jgi:hypothetical protein
MKRIRIIGLTLLALFALGAVAATVASAEEGLLPLTKKGAKVEGGLSTLETTGGAAIICLTLDPSTITFTNDKHASGTLHWLHCLAFGFPANSLGDGSAEILVPVLFLICLINSAALTFGVAAEVSKVHLEVPAAGVLVIVNGLVIGSLGAKAGEKVASTTVSFSGSKGIPTVKECSDSSGTKKHTLTGELNENGKPEAASENVVEGKVTYEEKLELMDT